MTPALVLTAIAPVMAILALGFWAGKQGIFNPEQARGLSTFALHFALPAALFLSMAQLDHRLLLQQGPMMVIMLIGYSAYFLIAYLFLRALKLPALRATLLGYTVSSTAVPIYGLTVLVPIFGTQIGTGVVGLAALVTNLAQVSVVIFMLQEAAASAAGNDGGKPGFVRVIGDAVMNPLVWCPMAGTLFSAFGLHLPPMINTALNPLDVCAAGVAIFACGLILAGYKLHMTSRTVFFGTLASLIVQPLLFFAVIKLWGIGTMMAKATFVAAAMPTGTPSALFAQQYKDSEAEIASIMLLTTIAMLVTLPASLFLSGYL